MKNTFPLGVRLFSCVRTKIPDRLVKNLEQKFAGVADADYQKVSVPSLEAAETALDILDRDLKRGCVESAKFVYDLQSLKKNPAELCLQNFSLHPPTAQYLSDAIGGLIDPNFILHKSSLTYSGRPDITAHSDNPRSGSDFKLDLLLLAGIKSNGQVRTYTMGLEQIVQKLSEQERKILAQPMFGYLGSHSNRAELPISRAVAETLKSKILHQDEEGNWRVNFSYYLRDELAFNQRATKFSKDEVDGATAKMHEVVQGLYERGEVKSWHIEMREALVLLNRQFLHGRDFSKLDRGRLLFASSYLLPNSEIKNLDCSELRSGVAVTSVGR